MSNFRIRPTFTGSDGVAKKLLIEGEGGPTLINDLITISAGQGALDAYQGYLLSRALVGIGYGTVTTAAATAAKVGTLSGFVRSTGSIVGLTFTYSNTVANPTLNVNSTGAGNIYYNNTYISSNMIIANTLHLFQFNGTQWVLLNPANLNAPLASPAFTGTPTAPTQVTTDNSTRVATTAFVKSITGDIATILASVVQGV